MCIPKCLFTTAVMLLFFAAHGQQFSATPASIRWRQINNDTFRIIFPEGDDSVARNIAAATRFQQAHYAGTLGSEVHKINIVLRTGLTYFNGYVGLGPYRSEFYLLPPQNPFELGAQSPSNMLAIHEYRHVIQYSNFRKGLSKTAYLLFGQNGQALANDAAVPNWFYEGDAVYAETKLTKQGRGRLPHFFNGYKALALDNRHYSYRKLRNGSLKDFVPSHYPLGYMLVAYGRQQYGDYFWRDVTGDAVRFKPLIYPFQGALKRHAGIPYKKFVQDAFSHYTAQWQAEDAPPPQWITGVQQKAVANYQYPYKQNDSTVVVLKNSFNTVPFFMRVTRSGREETIAAQSITRDHYFSYNYPTIAYAALQPDRRWGYREYSVIKLVNVETGKEKTITHKTRYFSPDISHDGSKVAAVALLPNQQSTLDILDREGKLLQTFSNANNEVYAYPKFSADDQSVLVTLRKPDGAMSLQQFFLDGKEKKVLLPFANRLLGFPAVQGDTLLYTVTGKESDEVHAYLLSKGVDYGLARYPTGLYGGALLDSSTLVSSTQTADGNRLGAWRPDWLPNADTARLATLYVQVPPSPEVVSNVSAANFSLDVSSKYKRLTHPFNFHSWQPDFANPLFTFSVFGENVLNTVQTALYYQFNTVERYHQAGANLVYGAWYLQPFVNVSETFNRRAYNDSNQLYTWNEGNAGAGLRLPLNFSGGKQYRYLTATTSFNLRNRQFTGNAKENYTNDVYPVVQGSLAYVGQKQQAVQHIFPHWAQSVQVTYRALAQEKKAWQWLLSGSLYLPGIAPSHSIVLNGAFQTSDTLANYRFGSAFPFSRGYQFISDRVYPHMYKAGVNYHFPLLYPDWGFGNLLYLRRLRGNVFFDYTELRTTNTRLYKPAARYGAAGAELYLDTRWWNHQNITVGVRYSRLLNTKDVSQQPNQWMLILPASIFDN